MRETLFEQEVLHQRMDTQGTYGGSYTYVRPSLNKQDCRKWVFCYINIRKRYLQCSLIYWGHLNFYCAKNSRYKHPSAGDAEWIKAKKYKRSMMSSKWIHLLPLRLSVSALPVHHGAVHNFNPRTRGPGGSWWISVHSKPGRNTKRDPITKTKTNQQKWEKHLKSWLAI